MGGQSVRAIPTDSLSMARVNLGAIVDRALAGEPQRITCHGRDAVILVSEAEWASRPVGTPTLGHLLAAYAETGVLGDDMTARPWVERELGVDLE